MSERSGRRDSKSQKDHNALCPHVNDLTSFIPLCDLEQVPQLPYPSQLGHVFVVCVCMCALGCGEMSPYIKCCG